jgi:hypothetical protein
MLTKHINLFVLLLIVLTSACSNNDDKQEQIDTGRAYFPLFVGMERVYSIDSLAYDNNAGITQIDTFRYVYREVITEKMTNGAGEEQYVVSRFYADTLGGNWRPANRFTAKHTELHAIITEENRPIIKLAFPAELNKNWNGNLFNTQGFQRFRITEIHQPFGQYNKTLNVVQQNDSNAIELIRKNERYAENIGLVLLRYDSLNTQVAGTRGFRKTQVLIQN